MFIVCLAVPLFNQFDGFAGTRYYPVDGLPGYETVGLAHRMAGRLEAKDTSGCDGAPREVSYAVIDTNRGPVARPAREADEFDEIHF